MLINKALVKYGYSNFSLEILEYCDPALAISREQYYIDLLKPIYNLAKVAGSTFFPFFFLQEKKGKNFLF